MENFTRRLFGKYAGTALLALATGASAVTMVGCNVVSSIMTWIPIGLTALEGIVTLLGPFIGPGATAIIVLIKAAFADLAAAVSQYNADTNPLDKATLLAKIRTFLAAIVAHFQDFLNALNLGNNPIVNIVIGLVGIILSAIEGFMGQLPPPVALTTSFHVGTRTEAITPKFYKSVGAFKADFNRVASANGHPEVEIH